jgi:competence protein ComEA
LDADARVHDALVAAGGLTENADRKAVNLAAKIADGQKIYIPAIGESPVQVLGSTVSGSSGTDGSGLVSVNNASQSELESLPGIGPVTSQKIIDGRPYSSIEDLVSKKVVGQKTYDKIISLISL